MTPHSQKTESNNMSKVQDYSKKYLELRDKRDKAKKDAEEAQVVFDLFRKRDFVSIMEDMGVESMRVKDIGVVSITTDAYTSVKKENREAAYKWLKDNGHGDVIKNNVNSSTMKALLKDLRRQGVEFPEEIFSFTPFSYVKINKS